MAARGDIFGLEVAVDDGKFKALARTRLAGRRVLGGRSRAGEAFFLLALARTPVSVGLIAVVAVLAGIEVAVATGCRAGLGLAGAVQAVRLFGAGLGAARIVRVTVEQAVHGFAAGWQLGRIGAAVALLAYFRLAVATVGLDARLTGRGTVESRLGLARAGAPVAACGVAVVARLGRDDLFVAAKGNALLSRHWTDPARFDGLAVLGTAIAVYGIAVVARLVRSQDVVAADREVLARLALFGAHIVRLDLATCTTTVTALGIAVVALLDPFDDAIAALSAARTIRASVRNRRQGEAQATARAPVLRTAVATAGAPLVSSISTRSTNDLGVAAAQSRNQDNCPHPNPCEMPLDCAAAIAARTADVRHCNSPLTSGNKDSGSTCGALCPATGVSIASIPYRPATEFGKNRR